MSSVSEEVADILNRFFGGDQDKVLAWMSTDNPMLGGISPIRMMILGRGDRLLKWMRQAVSENEEAQS